MPSEILTRQEAFFKAFSLLSTYAVGIGGTPRFDDAFRNPQVHGAFGTKFGYAAACSVHKLRLAVDLVGCSAEQLERMHDYWDRLGGAQRIKGDMGHFSFEWKGYW